MITSPLVSVVVPVFNTAQYLPRCLDSIVDQTLRELEIIIVDDGSTDGSQQIIDDYAERDRRIRIVRHETNLGLHIARIDAVLASTGDYLAYVDSDDYVTRDIFEYLHTTACEEGADIVRMSARIIDETRSQGSPDATLSFADGACNSGIEHLNADYYPAMCLHIHHRKLWTRALPYFPRTRIVGEDNLTSFVLAFFATRVISSSRIGYFYVERGRTLMGDKSFASIVRHIEDRGRVVQMLTEFVKEFGGQANVGLGRTIDNNRGLLFSYIRSLPDTEREAAITWFEHCWQERVPDELRLV